MERLILHNFFYNFISDWGSSRLISWVDVTEESIDSSLIVSYCEKSGELSKTDR